jgi:hypothetical protein
MSKMPKIRTIDELREHIRDLEHQNYVNEQHMRQRVADIAESLKPVNLVKGLVGNFIGRPEVKTNVFKWAAGLATSFLVKKFFKKGIAAKA